MVGELPALFRFLVIVKSIDRYISFPGLPRVRRDNVRSPQGQEGERVLRLSAGPGPRGTIHIISILNVAHRYRTAAPTWGETKIENKTRAFYKPEYLTRAHNYTSRENNAILHHAIYTAPPVAS